MIIILLAQEPYDIELLSDNGSKPTVEFITVKNYSINESGIGMFAKADNAKRFNDKDVLYNVEAYMQKNGTFETLKSNNVTLKDEIMYFDGDVVYTRDNVATLKTQEVVYNQKSNTLTGKTPFELNYQNSIAYGKNFIYHTKIGKLEAENVKAIMKMDKK